MTKLVLIFFHWDGEVIDADELVEKESVKFLYVKEKGKTEIELETQAFVLGGKVCSGNIHINAPLILQPGSYYLSKGNIEKHDLELFFTKNHIFLDLNFYFLFRPLCNALIFRQGGKNQKTFHSVWTIFNIQITYF